MLCLCFLSITMCTKLRLGWNEICCLYSICTGQFKYHVGLFFGSVFYLLIAISLGTCLKDKPVNTVLIILVIE